MMGPFVASSALHGAPAERRVGHAARSRGRVAYPAFRGRHSRAVTVSGGGRLVVIEVCTRFGAEPRP